MSVLNFTKGLILIFLLTTVIYSCKEDDDFNEGPFQSKRTAITSFSFDNFQPRVVGVINADDSTVTLTVPFGTDRRSLVPTITISDKATVAPASGIANDFTNPTNYIVTAENGTTQTWRVVVNLGDENAVPKLQLSNPIWDLSTSGTGKPAFFTADGERGMAYGNGRLYLTSNNDKILVINPNNGTQVGTLNMTGVEGGEPKIADVEVSADGTILACNTVEWTSTGEGAPTTFKIYKWDSETSQPEVWLTYTNTQFRMGDSFSVTGDIKGDAVILTAFGRKFLEPTDRGNKVFKWTVTNGVLNPQPEIIDIQGLPSLTRFGSRPYAQMLTPTSDEIYVNANDIDFTRVGLDGSFQARIPNSSRQLYDGFTSYFKIFEFAGKRVLATAFPRSNVESRLILIDITNGIENVTSRDVILSKNFMQGSGEIANVNASGAVAVNVVDENNAEVYCLITNQALVKYNLTTSIE